MAIPPTRYHSAAGAAPLTAECGYRDETFDDENGGGYGPILDKFIPSLLHLHL